MDILQGKQKPPQLASKVSFLQLVKRMALHKWKTFAKTAMSP
jgi:hypothetical protein